MRVPIRKPGKFTHLKPDPHMTAEKLDELKVRLARLKSQQPALAEEVNRLAQLGDLSENAGYQIAKGKLRSVNQKILDLQDQIHGAVIITPVANTGVVTLGSNVTIEINGQQFTYLILGSSETDPAKNIISHKSPIGSALMGRGVGDEVQIKQKERMLECTIVGIA